MIVRYAWGAYGKPDDESRLYVLQSTVERLIVGNTHYIKIYKVTFEHVYALTGGTPLKTMFGWKYGDSTWEEVTDRSEESVIDAVEAMLSGDNDRVMSPTMIQSQRDAITRIRPF